MESATHRVDQQFLSFLHLRTLPDVYSFSSSRYLKCLLFGDLLLQ